MTKPSASRRSRSGVAMSDIEPTEPYVYQPEPVDSPLAPRLWSVSGPGAEDFQGIRLEKKHAKSLARLLLRVRNLNAAIDAQQYDDLVSANISTLKDIHEKSLRLISDIVSQSLAAHPHYEDSYPKVLGLVERDKRISELEAIGEPR